MSIVLIVLLVSILLKNESFSFVNPHPKNRESYTYSKIGVPSSEQLNDFKHISSDTTLVSKFHYNTFLSDDGTWGYNILTNNEVIIHQPNIPCVEGNRGFNSAMKAETVARFIVNKLSNNIMPPTITKKELKSLGVIE